MTDDELTQVVEAIEVVMGRRMEEVYAALEQLRGEFATTINVMDQNDHAILGEIRRVQGGQVEGLMERVGESWERYVRGEAEALGLKVSRVLTKGKVEE